MNMELNALYDLHRKVVEEEVSRESDMQTIYEQTKDEVNVSSIDCVHNWWMEFEFKEYRLFSPDRRGHSESNKQSKLEKLGLFEPFQEPIIRSYLSE